MFEKWFGGKNKVEGINSDKNSVEGVAHFDGTKTEKDLLNKDSSLESLEFIKDKEIDVEGVKISMAKNNKPDDYRSSRNVSNERKKEGINDRRSDWKEREPFALDLPEEVEDRQTLNEKHLNAMAERYDEGDDFEEGNNDLEKAA